MLKVLIFKFDNTDGLQRDLETAFNLLADFCSELRIERADVAKSYHRIVKNREFTFADVDRIARYALKIKERVNKKYEAGQPLAMAPWREQVLRNVQNLEQVIGQLLREVNSLMV